jgi:hypothetical protein
MGYYILAIILIAIFVWLLCIFVTAFQLANPSVQASIIAGAFLLIAGITAHHFNFQREVGSRHFNEKREVYLKFVSLYFDLLSSSNKNKPLPEKEIIKRMSDFKKDLLLWGSGSMIKTWLSFEDSCCENRSEDIVFISDTLETILRKMRSDLGHNDFREF